MISDPSYSLNIDSLIIKSGGQLILYGGTIYTNNVNDFGSIIISAGTLDIDANYFSTGNITPSLNGGNIMVGGNFTVSGSGFNPGGGSVEFSGSVAQTISLAAGNNFYDLTINNSHASDKVSAQGSALVVSNHLNIVDGIFESASDYHDVTIASGATLELTGDITVSGNWTNNGTFIHNNHNVTFDGSTTMHNLFLTSNFFYDLTINNSISEITLNNGVVVLGALI